MSVALARFRWSTFLAYVQEVSAKTGTKRSGTALELLEELGEGGVGAGLRQ
jgi:hypothetical protein